MSITTPTIEPSSVTAGDSLQFQIALPDYPASAGWVLSYTLIGLAGVPIVIESSASADDHLISELASVTASWTAGTYTAVKAVANSGAGERVTLARLPFEILPDPAGITAATDTRSHVKRVLDAIEAVIEGRASKGDQQLTIDGTTLVKMTAAELLELRRTYKIEYKKEQQAVQVAQGKNSGRKIVTRFTR